MFWHSLGITNPNPPTPPLHCSVNGKSLVGLGLQESVMIVRDVSSRPAKSQTVARDMGYQGATHLAKTHARSSRWVPHRATTPHCNRAAHHTTSLHCYPAPRHTVPSHITPHCRREGVHNARRPATVALTFLPCGGASTLAQTPPPTTTTRFY